MLALRLTYFDPGMVKEAWFRRYMHGELGVLDQAGLDVVYPANDSEQARIG